ncbi:hypothetical protein FHG87_002491 [Trinorchestia longiramus]|nr:hypothetical protein FHG87_002491 [Trinorchestia longiramus]
MVSTTFENIGCSRCQHEMRGQDLCLNLASEIYQPESRSVSKTVIARHEGLLPSKTDAFRHAAAVCTGGAEPEPRGAAARPGSEMPIYPTADLLLHLLRRVYLRLRVSHRLRLLPLRQLWKAMQGNAWEPHLSLRTSHAKHSTRPSTTTCAEYENKTQVMGSWFTSLLVETHAAQAA